MTFAVHIGTSAVVVSAIVNVIVLFLVARAFDYRRLRQMRDVARNEFHTLRRLYSARHPHPGPASNRAGTAAMVFRVEGHGGGHHRANGATR